MEITITRRRIAQILTGLALAVVLVAAGYLIYSKNLFAIWFKQGLPPSVSMITEEPALQALATFYSPDLTGEQAAWEDKVCAGMTPEGCDLFRKMYSPALWKAARSEPFNATVKFLSVAEILTDRSQIWKVNLVTLETTQPIYIHVTQNESGQWLLHRVLFAQEITKYEDQ